MDPMFGSLAAGLGNKFCCQYISMVKEPMNNTYTTKAIP